MRRNVVMFVLAGALGLLAGDWPPRVSARTSLPTGCCKMCTTGCPCGDSCISCERQCHKGPGCACKE